MSVCVHSCSNTTTGFLWLLVVIVTEILKKNSFFFVSSFTHYMCTPMCMHIYFQMNSSVCRLSAFAHENDIAQFPFLWTIQLPLSGRLMGRGLLDQCHCASGMPTSRSTVLLLPSPTYLHWYTRFKYIHLHFVKHIVFLANSSLTDSHPPVDLIHSDTWEANQPFSFSHSMQSRAVETRT